MRRGEIEGDTWFKVPVECNGNTVSYNQKHFNTVFQIISSKWINLISNIFYHGSATMYQCINVLYIGSKIFHINVCSNLFIIVFKKYSIGNM